MNQRDVGLVVKECLVDIPTKRNAYQCLRVPGKKIKPILIGLLVEENSMFVIRRRLLFGALMEDVL